MPHSSRSRTRRLFAAAALTLTAVVGGGYVATATGGSSSVAEAPRQATTTTTSTSSGSSAASDSFSQVPVVARKLQPSVVTIQTDSGLGSGVVWSADGMIVTDAHVVGTSKSVQVSFVDGKQVNATVKATDDVTDLAVVQADRTGLTPAKFVTAQPQLGDLAVVIGSPLGFTNSVTAGVISGENREIPGSASQTQSLVGLIQTDAAVSPGNSGGALANGAAGVTGLVEAYIPPSLGAVSLGFAIPAATVVDVANQLIANGKATHAYLGVASTAITPEIQQQLGLSTSKGVALQQVAANSPAAKAGLKSGDVIVDIDGQAITSPEDLLAVIRKHKPGDQITVTYIRDGRKATAAVTLADRPG
jgi:S1-C subfamily serine protease